jgi:hypothetical protein
MKKFHFLRLWATLLQGYYRRSPAAGLRRSIAITFHKRSSGQDRSNYLTLHTNSPAVNDPQSFETYPASFFQVLFDDGLDIPGRNAVQIEYIGDGNADWLFLLLHCC